MDAALALAALSAVVVAAVLVRARRSGFAVATCAAIATISMAALTAGSAAGPSPVASAVSAHYQVTVVAGEDLPSAPYETGRVRVRSAAGDEMDCLLSTGETLSAVTLLCP